MVPKMVEPLRFYFKLSMQAPEREKNQILELFIMEQNSNRTVTDGLWYLVVYDLSK